MITQNTYERWLIECGAATVDGDTLLNALASAGAWACKPSENIPHLQGALIETRGNLLTVAATDRYALIVCDIAADVDGEFSLMIDDLTPFIKALKAAKGQRVTISARGGVFTLSTADSEHKISASEYLFPHSYRSILGNIPEYFKGQPWIFDPALIAKIGKIKLPKNVSAVQMAFTDGGRIRGGGEVDGEFRFNFVIMPRRK